MDTLNDLKKYIQIEYGVEPNEFDGRVLRYRAISFERNTGSIMVQNQKTNDMWTIKRSGHSIDYFRTEELKSAVNPGGSLLYYFMPKSRI
jgi:hypothetical protein